MGYSPFPVFSFFGTFFLFHFRQFFKKIYLKNLFVCCTYCFPITLVLKNQKEAESGSAEVQPVRNIFGYLSMINASHYDSAIFLGWIIFFVSFIR